MSGKWRSKLGVEYEKASIEAMDGAMQARLKELRQRPWNRMCADCGTQGTVWAVVNRGTFVCMRCASVHRGLGTHVSVPKGLTGTYFWSPDELDAMRGNADAALVYGDAVLPDASDDALRRFLLDKYLRRKFAPSPRQTRRVSVSPPPQPDLLTPSDDFFAQYGLAT